MGNLIFELATENYSIHRAAKRHDTLKIMAHLLHLAHLNINSETITRLLLQGC